MDEKPIDIGERTKALALRIVRLYSGNDNRTRVLPMLKSTVQEHPSLGKSAQVRLESRSVTGVGLVEHERLVHLSVFRKKGMSGSVAGPRFRRFSDRRNHVVY